MDTIDVRIAGMGRMGTRHYEAVQRVASKSGLNIQFHFFDPHAQLISLGQGRIYKEECEFFAGKCDFLILAAPPQARMESAYPHLLRAEPIPQLILLEKPVLSSSQGDPSYGQEMLEAIGKKTVVNFPENADRLTCLLVRILKGETANIPSLTIQEVLMERYKNREREGPHETRATENLITQEGIHDIAWLMHICAKVGMTWDPIIRGALAKDLRHPTLGHTPLAGASSAILELPSALVTICTSFRAARRRKFKRLHCVDQQGKNFEIEINYLYRDAENNFPSDTEYRSLRVYDESGDLVFDAAQSAPEIIGMDKNGLDDHIISQFLFMLISGNIISNFELALEAERLCRQILEIQSQHGGQTWQLVSQLENTGQDSRRIW